MSNPNEVKEADHATTDVGSMRVARTYAEALLKAAARHDKGEEVLEELRSLVEDVLGQNPKLAEFFASKAVGRDHVAEVLRKVFLGRVSDTLGNFLLVLNDHERLDLLQPILRAYKELNNERNRRMIVQVRSAVPLLDHQRERLAAELRQAFHFEPVLETQIDPDLLGGLVVRVGDWLYDASVRNRLEALGTQLSERSSHEIQSGRDRFGS